ncbi:MAG: glycerophosphodiester phosphodiesterase family protein [Planctomycetia bacterium]|nr:glycerophosphodiester phosphodiesterase family protein [Planctomycetia bacterium]
MKKMCLWLLFLTGIAGSRTGMAEEPYYLNFHRGGGVERPENTLETFLWAWNLGVIPEGDVQFTKDGVAVMFHDRNIGRLAWGIPDEMKNRKISEMTWEDVRKLDVGRYCGEAFAGERIPTLESVLAAMSGFPERLLYQDEKGLTDEHLERIAQKSKQYGLEKQLFFTSGNYARMLRWNEICPQGVGMLWLGYVWTPDKKCNMPGLEAKLDELRKADFQGVTHLVLHIQTDFNQADPFSPSSEFLRKLAAEMKERGIPLEIITWSNGQNPRTYEELQKLGITGFATDYPSVLLKVLDK